jgi:hypothetical protein
VDGTRGATDWKVGYLRALMDRYGVPRKPLLNTEAALLCSTATPACSQAQANAIGRFYIRAIADGLLGHLWYIYDSDGFNHTALVEPSNVSVQRPIYQAYQNVAMHLGGARFLGRLSAQGAGVEGYRFSRTGQTIVIFWSDTQQQVAIEVAPSATITCVSNNGAPLPCRNDSGLVSLIAQASPTYVIIR